MTKHQERLLQSNVDSLLDDIIDPDVPAFMPLPTLSNRQEKDRLMKGMKFHLKAFNQAADAFMKIIREEKKINSPKSQENGIN